MWIYIYIHITIHITYLYYIQCINVCISRMSKDRPNGEPVGELPAELVELRFWRAGFWNANCHGFFSIGFLKMDGNGMFDKLDILKMECLINLVTVGNPIINRPQQMNKRMNISCFQSPNTFNPDIPFQRLGCGKFLKRWLGLSTYIDILFPQLGSCAAGTESKAIVYDSFQNKISQSHEAAWNTLLGTWTPQAELYIAPSLRLWDANG